MNTDTQASKDSEDGYTNERMYAECSALACICAGSTGEGREDESNGARKLKRDMHSRFCVRKGQKASFVQNSDRKQDFEHDFSQNRSKNSIVNDADPTSTDWIGTNNPQTAESFADWSDQ